MLEARVGRGALLKKIFEAIKDLVPEVNLECSEEGIQCQALDSSHAALVSLELKSGFFSQYQCSRAYCLGLNLTSVSKIFRLCGNDDIVIIRHLDDTDTVSFVFEASHEDRITDFELRLLNIDQEHLGVQDTDYTTSLAFSSRLYAKMCADLGQFSDTITLECTSKSIRWSSKGDIGAANITMKPASGAAEEENVELKCTEPVSLLFAVRYLTQFAKSQPLANRLQLEMSPDHPLRVSLALDDNAELGLLRFYLAPKISDASQMDDE